MGLLKLFAKKDRIDRVIKELSSEKEQLEDRVRDKVLEELLEMFPGQSVDEIKSKYSSKIKEIETSLYEEYRDEIDLRINRLILFKKRLYPSTKEAA